jgi:hypothetical protein
MTRRLGGRDSEREIPGRKWGKEYGLINHVFAWACIPYVSLSESNESQELVFQFVRKRSSDASVDSLSPRAVKRVVGVCLTLNPFEER